MLQIQHRLINKIAFLFLIYLGTAAAQSGNEPILIIGNELIGRVENGQSVREVNGNVVLKQGNVTINCDRAIQYLAQNNARLIGNVIVHQDTLTIKTPEGYYYGNDKRAYSNRGVELNDKKVILTASEGEYFFKLHKADFNTNVKLYDTASTLTSQKLIYYRFENKAIASKSVKIVESENTIYADSLIHLRNEKTSFCFSNILLRNSKDGMNIFGEHLEDYRAKNYSLIDKAPLLIQFDTSYNAAKDSIIRIDTLTIKSNRMEAFRDSTNLFLATGDVKIIRSDFSSLNDITKYSKNLELIETWKVSDSARIPTLWYSLNQMTGDSIRILLKDNRIQKTIVKLNAMLISQNEKYQKRMDQISGSSITLFFNDNKLVSSDIAGNALSYYYLYDDGEPNGIIKASARELRTFFEEKQVSDVKLYGDPKSEFHPEALVKGKENQFILPGMKLYTDKPIMSDLISAKQIAFLNRTTPNPKKTK